MTLVIIGSIARMCNTGKEDVIGIRGRIYNEVIIPEIKPIVIVVTEDKLIVAVNQFRLQEGKRIVLYSPYCYNGSSRQIIP